MVVSTFALLWLVVRAFHLPKLGRLVGAALAIWATAWVLHFATARTPWDRSGIFVAFLWLLVYAGYVPFVMLLRQLSLSEKVRAPTWAYAFAFLPALFTLAVSPFSGNPQRLPPLLILQLALIHYGLPAWYAAPLGRAPEGRAIWLPTLIFVQMGVTSWASLPTLGSHQGLILGFPLWTLSLWLIVEGLWLELTRKPIGLIHLTLVVTTFMAMWAMVILNQLYNGVGSAASVQSLVLSSIVAWGGILSVVLTLHLLKARSEAQLTRWNSILSDLALFPASKTPPDPESLTRELFDLFRRTCPNVTGLRMSVFGDLIVGERTQYGRTLADRGIELGRIYLGGDRQCGPFFMLLLTMASQRLGEVLQSLDWRLQAHTDPLTGLLNRRGFEVKLPYVLERAVHGKKPIVMGVLDLDHFKRINDRYGHTIGDVVLQAVAEQLDRNLRENDLAVRWGGEEFLVLLFDSDLPQAQQIFERIRERIGELRLTDVQEKITVSVGLAGGRAPRERADVFKWTLQADSALRKAKAEGRDRIVSTE